MKKIILLTLLSLISLNSYSQQRKLNLTDFKTWSLQANSAMNWAHTDVVQNTPFYSSVNYKLGYGLRLNKFLTHNLGLAVDGYRTQFEGVDGIWSYKTKINYQLSLLAMVQSGNIRYLNEFDNFQLYGYLGYGTINYESSLVNSNNSIKNNDVKENQQVIPIGVGIKYHLKENVTLNLEYSMSNINSDNLDGFNDRFTEKDSYSKLQLGVSYTFGKSYDKELEWHDPRPRITNQPVRKDTVVIIQKLIYTDTTQKSTEIINKEQNSIDSSSYKDLIATVYYDFNNYKLDENNSKMIIDFLSKYKEITKDNIEGYNITVESFTDKIGSENNNKIIVRRRANEVVNLITSQGFEKKLINVILHGEQSAISEIDSLNRKTIIHIEKN